MAHKQNSGAMPEGGIPLLPQSVLDGIGAKTLDIPYASISPSQRLDLYYPDVGSAPYPLVIHVHGGAFLFGTKRDVNLMPMLAMREYGFAVCSVQYRLSAEARFPALVYDVKAAIRFLRANAVRLSLDASRFAIWGPSAGGYLAAMIGATQGNPAFEDLSMGNADASSDVSAVVDWCGPAGDFALMDEQIRDNGVGVDDHDEPDSPESLLLGHAVRQVRELSRLAAPVSHVHKDIPPFLIHHGESDPIVPVQQSLALAREIERVAGKGRVIIETFAGQGHHGQPWYETPEMIERVGGFLQRVWEEKKQHGSRNQS